MIELMHGPMKMLHVQLQPTRSPGLDEATAVKRLTDAGHQCDARSRVTEGVDACRYVNLDFCTTDLVALWAAVRVEVQTVRGLSAAAIVCCQGEFGWDDYLLLHHFDPAEPLDELP